ncbi:MAG: SDR family NAD(P)-dependent oxidoreductase [Solobacterium sp.]|nr:SDR family NAD(P)-dependent oxidoreductase [Solobacterium sp.]
MSGQRKTAVITGGSEGIGFALAECFARDGYDIVLCARNEEKLQRAAAKLQAYGTQVRTIALDLTAENAPEELFARCPDADVLVNNAGTGANGLLWQVPQEVSRQITKLNIEVPLALMKLYLKRMCERGAGEIINLGSTGAFQPGPYIAEYYASKSYILSISQAADLEAKQYGVRVYCFSPGPTATAFYAKTGGHMPSFAMSAEEAARYMYAHRGGKCVVVPGLINRLARLAPQGMRSRFVMASKKKHLK